MGRFYSKSGCTTCKRRRKKCDEEKPSCGACSRLGLQCLYADVTSSETPSRRVVSNQTYDLDLKPPQTQTSLLPIAQFRTHELPVITRVPASISRFFIPTLDRPGREVKSLMQLTFTNLTVRDAVVSCFSAILPPQNKQNSDLNRIALGSALRSVRSQINDPKGHFEDLSELQVAIQFLGLLESIGPQECSDPVTHWIALSTLAGHLAQKHPFRGSPLPRNLYILALEAIVYHFASLIPFTENVTALARVWQQSDIYSLLLHKNPKGENRLPSSPLLGGQYELWRSAFEVLYWSRSPTTFRPNSIEIQQKKESVKRIQSDLDRYYDMSQVANQRERRSMVDVYNLHCISLLIALTALDEATEDRAHQINSLVKIGVQKFSDWQLISRPYPTAMWAVHVLACAISEQDDWSKLNAKISCLKPYMDKGHLRRLESVLAQAALARACHIEENGDSGSSDPGHELPGSLFLLHQPEGILHDWRISSDT